MNFTGGKTTLYSLSYWKIQNGFVKGTAKEILKLQLPIDSIMKTGSYISIGKKGRIAISANYKVYIYKFDEQDNYKMD